MRAKGLRQIEEALRGIDGRAEVAQALCREMAPVHEYDVRTGSDLMLTLRTYAENGGKLAATAEGLFLHRNSVQYRLQRIEELSGVDPRDRATRLLLTVAFAMADPSMLEPPAAEEDEHEG